MSASGQVRTNFANTHMANAHRFASLVHQVETANAGQPLGSFFEDIRANAVASVMSSVASLEAYLNEVQFDPVGHFPNQEPELVRLSLTLVERRPLVERIAFLAVLNGKQKPDMDRTPGQNVAVLVKLRNALIHFRPEWPDEAEAHDKLGAKLRHRFALSPFFEASEPIFPRACMSYGCAKWAVENVRDFVIEYAEDNGWQCGLKKMLPRLELP